MGWKEHQWAMTGRSLHGDAGNPELPTRFISAISITSVLYNLNGGHRRFCYRGHAKLEVEGFSKHYPQMGNDHLVIAF